jgi:hypothetical protein
MQGTQSSSVSGLLLPESCARGKRFSQSARADLTRRHHNTVLEPVDPLHASTITSRACTPSQKEKRLDVLKGASHRIIAAYALAILLALVAPAGGSGTLSDLLGWLMRVPALR